jgi:aspartyl-tRNA(Asn)/glutamyl-tRNA(Gln) amidotransferase subunit B
VLEYLGVYDPAREMSLRVDANISMDGGERVEIKNITGFESVEKALNYEIVRQSGMRRMAATVQRETRHFNAELKTTSALRKKEYEEDYGYIFDPDLPMVTLSEAHVSSIKAKMPELPEQRAERLSKEYGMDISRACVIVYNGKPMADFFETSVKLYNNPDGISNWIVNYLMKSLNWRGERISNSKVRPNTFVELVEMVDKNEITERYAKELVKSYVDTGTSPRKLAEGEKVVLTEKDIVKIVSDIIVNNKKASDELKAGKKEAMQFLIGEALKQTKRQANPNEIREILTKLIGKST